MKKTKDDEIEVTLPGVASLKDWRALVKAMESIRGWNPREDIGKRVAEAGGFLRLLDVRSAKTADGTFRVYAVAKKRDRRALWRTFGSASAVLWSYLGIAVGRPDPPDFEQLRRARDVIVRARDSAGVGLR